MNWNKIRLGALLAGVLLLSACAGLSGVKGELSDTTIAQLTPAHERYILLADIKTWTGVARNYAERPFCTATPVVGCAEKKVVIALDKVTSRLGPTVEVLRATTSSDKMIAYLSLGTSLLLQLQAELANAVVQEAL